MHDFPKILIVLGILLMVFGLALSGRLGPLGRLPGDITIERGNWSFHAPILTSIILSIILTLVLSFFRRW